MKNSIICFLALALFSVIIVYGQENWIDEFIETFELSNSDFKFYNMKSSVLIEKDMSIDQLEAICVEIAKNLNVDINKMNVKVYQSEVYVNYKI